MGVCTIGLKVWNKDGYGRREYVQRVMYNLKLEWAIGKMNYVRKWLAKACGICKHPGVRLLWCWLTSVYILKLDAFKACLRFYTLQKLLIAEIISKPDACKSDVEFKMKHLLKFFYYVTLTQLLHPYRNILNVWIVILRFRFWYCRFRFWYCDLQTRRILQKITRLQWKISRSLSVAPGLGLWGVRHTHLILNHALKRESKNYFFHHRLYASQRFFFQFV